MLHHNGSCPGGECAGCLWLPRPGVQGASPPHGRTNREFASLLPAHYPAAARNRQDADNTGSPPLRGKFGGKPRGKEASFVLPEKKSTNQVTEDSPCQISITRKKVARKKECGFPSTCRNSISSRKSARRPA